MNATYNIDHLQAVTHATSLLNASTTLGDAVAVNRPKNATTNHYDPTGQQIASKSTTSYEGVKFAADGSISGGSLSHNSTDPNGVKLSTTAVGFGNDGKPNSAQIDVNNKNGEGNFKTVKMDMSGVTWNNSLGVSSGQVNIKTMDGASGLTKHDGAIQFDKENIVSGSITHYNPDNGKDITGYTDVDYSQTKFLGTSLIGGQYSVNSHTAEKALKSTSTVAVSSLGRPQSIQTSNQDPTTKAITSNVNVDFSKLAFNARNEFDSGELNYTAKDSNNNLLSQTNVTYNDAQPALSNTQVYNNEQLQNKIVVDYSDSLFDNDHKVVNSIKKVEVYSNSNELISSNVIAYDENGKKLKDDDPKAKKIKANKPVKPSKKKSKDESAPSPLQPALKSGDSNTSQQTNNINRTDGTLEESRVTTLQDGKPVFALITMYAADGKTVTKTFTLDLTGLAYDTDSKTVSGALNMQTHSGDNVLQSDSSIQY
jgi:hypothetical protein